MMIVWWPAHSFKFAARLQEYNASNNPVLIRIETNAGHGAGKPTNKQIDEAADTWSFVMQNLGMTFDEKAEEQKKYNLSHRGYKKQWIKEKEAAKRQPKSRNKKYCSKIASPY